MDIDFKHLTLLHAKHVCRVCLEQTDTNMCFDDFIEHELSQIKIIDMLIFLDCLEIVDQENLPRELCTSCISSALVAYNFKLRCLKANRILSRLLNVHNSHPDSERKRPLDSIDINVIYQDHEYLSFFSSDTSLKVEPKISENEELTPLPPVTEITSAEKIPTTENDKNFVCTLCPKSFTRLYGLRYHMAKHFDVRKYLCSKCGKGFHSPNALSQHNSTHKEVAKFKCGFCNKTYRARKSLKDHFRIAHSSNSKLFSCVICSKKFTAKSTLVMHMKMHSGEKKFKCANCPKRYTRATYLKIHSLVHTNQVRPRPFACDHEDCDRSFSTKHSLQVHIAHTHTSERPHKCEICLKGFATSTGLRIHKECHNNKPINCDICGMIVKSRKILQKHLKSHDTHDMISATVDDIFFEHFY